jgi:hypothetical protein
VLFARFFNVSQGCVLFGVMSIFFKFEIFQKFKSDANVVDVLLHVLVFVFVFSDVVLKSRQLNEFAISVSFEVIA